MHMNSIIHFICERYEAYLQMPQLILPLKLQCEWLLSSVSLHSHSQFADKITVKVSLMPRGLIVKDVFLIHVSAFTVTLNEI